MEKDEVKKSDGALESFVEEIINHMREHSPAAEQRRELSPG